MMFGWLNRRRLRDYPRLIGISTLLVLVGNLVFREGWLGGVGQIIGSDFIMFYAVGLMYWTDLAHLYDPEAQWRLQQTLISPTILPGLNPYMSPPYVAMVHGLFTFLPLPWAFAVWLVLSVIFVGLAVYLVHRFLVPSWLSDAGLTRFQLGVLVFSTFAFVEGVLVGQNHGLTLLLVTGIVISTLRGKKWLAGILAGLLIYKPHFVLGFLILWLFWREFQSLGSFVLVSLLWGGAGILFGNLDAYWAYLELGPTLLRFPYLEGFPAFVMITPYGLLTTLFPLSALPWIQKGFTLWSAALTAGLAALALRSRKGPVPARISAVVAASFFPLLSTPYALLHDMLMLIPGFILLCREREKASQSLKLALFMYLGMLLFTVLGAQLKVALPALIPLGIGVVQVSRVWSSWKKEWQPQDLPEQ